MHFDLECIKIVWWSQDPLGNTLSSPRPLARFKGPASKEGEGREGERRVEEEGEGKGRKNK